MKFLVGHGSKHHTPYAFILDKLALPDEAATGGYGMKRGTGHPKTH